MLKRFDNGILENTYGKRYKDRNFSDIKDKPIKYTKIRAKNYKQEKCGTSWLLFQEKSVKWSVDLYIENFKCSHGMISDTLRCHGIKKSQPSWQEKLYDIGRV